VTVLMLLGMKCGMQTVDACASTEPVLKLMIVVIADTICLPRGVNCFWELSGLEGLRSVIETNS